MIEKELVGASTEPLILSLLSKGESYGYELIQEVKRLSGALTSKRPPSSCRLRLPGCFPWCSWRPKFVKCANMQARLSLPSLMALRY